MSAKRDLWEKKSGTKLHKWRGVSITPSHFCERMTEENPPSGKSRKWTFTLNNYTPAHETRIARMDYEQLRYVAYSREVAPTTGTPHLQGFVYLHVEVTLAFFKKFLPSAHMEIMEGSFMHNEVYCSKQESLIEYGDRPEQGKRTDLTMCKRRIDEGTDYMDLAEEENYFKHVAKHHKFFSKYQEHKRRKRLEQDREAPNVTVIIGGTGKGKSRWCDEQFGLGGYKEVPDLTGQWFDEYCGTSDNVVFNDVSIGQVPPPALFKRLTDRYPIQVPIKGGFVTWKPKHIVFTSNHEMINWWDANKITPHDYSAITRRITQVIRLGFDY